MVKLTVYNLLNQETRARGGGPYQRPIGGGQHPEFGLGTTYQSPRYGQLTLKLNF